MSSVFLESCFHEPYFFGEVLVVGAGDGVRGGGGGV